MEAFKTLYCKWKGCIKYFPDEEILLNHVTEVHIGRKSTNNLCLDCHWDNCGVKTTKRDHITSHMKVHIAYKPHTCRYCEKAFKRPQDLKKHEKLHAESQEKVQAKNLAPNVGIDLNQSSGSYLDPNLYRDNSPLSASSENLIASPPNPDQFANQELYNFLNGVQNKQFTPDYNTQMESMLNNMKYNLNQFQMDANFQNNFDLNYFNDFMFQLQSNIASAHLPHLNMDYNMANPQQQSFNMNGLNLNQFQNTDLSQSMTDFNFGLSNNLNSLPTNTMEYNFNSTHNSNFPAPTAPSQPYQGYTLPSQSYNSGADNITNFNFNQPFDPELQAMLFSMGQTTDLDNSISAPQVQTFNQTYNMMNVTPLRKEAKSPQVSDKFDGEDEELDSLIKGMRSMEIKAEAKEAVDKESNTDNLWLEHIKVIREIIQKVNRMAPQNKKENKIGLSKDIKPLVSIEKEPKPILTGYPSLDDL